MFDSDIINSKTGRRYINDIYLLAAFLLLAGAAFALIQTIPRQGEYIRISSVSDTDSSDTEYGVYSLERDGYLVFIGSDHIKISPLLDDEDMVRDYLKTNIEGFERVMNDQGPISLDEYDLRSLEMSASHINILRIHDLKADMVNASCPDLICVKTKPVSRIAESVVCLPHRLMITVVSDPKPYLYKEDTDEADKEPDTVTW